MLLGIQFAGSFGAHPGAWRMPAADPAGYSDIDQIVRHAQVADQGGIQYIFVPDRPLLDADLAEGPPRFQMEPTLLLTAIARATTRIGLIPSVSTSLVEPYTIARQLKALDVISHGRAGWNAIGTNDPAAFANYGVPMPPRMEKYERLHETIQIVQALWGSWGHDAGSPDKNGRFADPTHVRPIDLAGRHVAARGPLPIPPSEQGQPVIVQAGGGGLGLQAAARYADVIVGMAMTI
ncbi:LLM class flavin-dependent oxidoreductase [Planctomonas deserti]|uniref:LLM class flavin-dependent oxidoreductase n=1 Tax=Planctomonas deserti TaxID=2144185 RepID=UPI00197B6205|nr:LLM class flavin-dependent oxidoreductase [Planctomonas deserti]